MEQVVLEASLREAAGKGGAREVRRQGLIPGVVYGLGQAPVNLSVEREGLERAIKREGGSNVLFNLKVEGLDAAEGTAALVKDLQRHPISRIPESVDFQWVSLKELVQVSVPVVLQGTSRAIVDGAGVDQMLHEVEVSCLPLAIPQHLVLSIEGIELHETRTVEALQVPGGVTVLAPPDAPVVSCFPPRAEEPTREAEPVEGELTAVSEE